MYTFNPNLRRATQDKQATGRQGPYKLFCKEQLEKYNVGLITADEYYQSVADARLLLV